MSSVSSDPAVVYIGGYGRSGSTLLDIILNAHPEMVTAGALSNFADWVVHGRTCACGATLRECPFWSAVLRDVNLDDGDYATFVEDQLRFESRGAADAGTADRAAAERHAGRLRALVGAIARVSGQRLIIDSSKSAGQAARRPDFLASEVGVPVKMIWLVRDVRAVTWSAMRGPGSPEREQGRGQLQRIASAVLGWRAANLAAQRTRATLGAGNVLFLRYEDLASDPVTAVTRICAFVGVPADPLVALIASDMPFEPGHNLGGNRLRMTSTIRVRPDTEWRSRLPTLYAALAWAITARQSRAFGYVWSGEPGASPP